MKNGLKVLFGLTLTSLVSACSSGLNTNTFYDAMAIFGNSLNYIYENIDSLKVTGSYERNANGEITGVQNEKAYEKDIYEIDFKNNVAHLTCENSYTLTNYKNSSLSEANSSAFETYIVYENKLGIVEYRKQDGNKIKNVIYDNNILLDDFEDLLEYEEDNEAYYNHEITFDFVIDSYILRLIFNDVGDDALMGFFHGQSNIPYSERYLVDKVVKSSYKANYSKETAKMSLEGTNNKVDQKMAGTTKIDESGCKIEMENKHGITLNGSFNEYQNGGYYLSYTDEDNYDLANLHWNDTETVKNEMKANVKLPDFSDFKLI